MSAGDGEGLLSGQHGREISEAHVDELNRIGLDYWWNAVRLGYIEAEMRRARPLRLLDMGCGPGTFLEHFIATHRPDRALGLDGTDEAVSSARSRGLPVSFADFRAPVEIDFEPTFITLLDVAEHLEDPVATLANVASVCAPGATLIATVPAMPSLYSRWDELSGHHRRYSRSLLQQHISDGGWSLRRIRYIFAYVAPAVWLQRRVLRRDQTFEFPEVPALASRALVTAGRLERWLGAPMPFGTSLVAVAERR